MNERYGYGGPLRRFESLHPKRHGIVLSPDHAAIREARSIFPTTVNEVGHPRLKRLLKGGENSRKIGKRVVKGKLKGFPIFTLTLEERATCPRTCNAWGFCYGNNMQAAERIVAGAELEAALLAELSLLQTQHPAGFLVRLHVLGDFYSLDYVRFWTSALDRYPALHIFGFTAHDPSGEIGAELYRISASCWDRFAVRFSGFDGPMLGSQLIPDPQAIPCPAQTDPRGERCCANCMLCVHSKRSIAFERH